MKADAEKAAKITAADQAHAHRLAKVVGKEQADAEQAAKAAMEGKSTLTKARRLSQMPRAMPRRPPNWLPTNELPPIRLRQTKRLRAWPHKPSRRRKPRRDGPLNWLPISEKPWLPKPSWRPRSPPRRSRAEQVAKLTVEDQAAVARSRTRRSKQQGASGASREGCRGRQGGRTKAEQLALQTKSEADKAAKRIADQHAAAAKAAQVAAQEQVEADRFAQVAAKTKADAEQAAQKATQRNSSPATKPPSPQWKRKLPPIEPSRPRPKSIRPSEKGSKAATM